MRRHVFAFLLAMACRAQAMDAIVFCRSASSSDARSAYAQALLHEVMERTAPQFGPYTFRLADTYMVRDRILWALKQGNHANVVFSPADPAFRHDLLSVDIPIDMGMQNWRIALVDGSRAGQVRTAVEQGQLRRLWAGVGSNWVSRGLMRANGYGVVSGGDYEGLFRMLAAGRFDYFPRGVQEVFEEYDTRRARLPNLALDDSFYLHLPLPTLFFVAPSAPRLQRRIQAGMEAMLKDGSLERFVLHHYRSALQRANLCGRQRIELVNTDADPAMLERKELWLDPFAPRHGFCTVARKPDGAPAGAERR